jgi:hypothetical protein
VHKIEQFQASTTKNFGEFGNIRTRARERWGEGEGEGGGGRESIEAAK